MKPICFLILLTVLTFCLVPGNDFAGDDELIFGQNPFYSSGSNFSRIFCRDAALIDPAVFSRHNQADIGTGLIAFRPVQAATYFIDRGLWGANPAGYHAANLILHTVNVVLIYGVLGLFLSPGAAVFAAALFAAHPVVVDPVANISSRADLLAGLFILISFWCFERSVTRRPGWGWGSLALLSYFFAVFSKESAGIYPLVIAAFFWLCRREKAAAPPRPGLRILPYGVIGSFYLFVYFAVFPTQALFRGASDAATVPAHPVWLNLWRVVFYLKEIIWLPGVNILPPFYNPDITSGFVGKACAGLAVLAGAVWGFWYFYRRDKTSAFLLCWASVFYLPVSGIIALANPTAHRFLYLSLIGAVGLLARHFLNWLERRPLGLFTRKLILIAIIAVCASRSFDLTRQWHDDISLSTAVIRSFPDHPKAYAVLGDAYFRQGKYAAARLALEQSVRLGSKDPRVFYDLGMSAANFAVSKTAFQTAIELDKEYVSPYIGLGRLYLLQGDYSRAVIFLRQAYVKEVTYASCGYYIQALVLIGQNSTAEQVLRQAGRVLSDPGQRLSLQKLFIDMPQQRKPRDIGI
ncbi:MAG: tetratricopeptide repeat protein [Candidatus Omnitrophica bacterium]|nr:tetratricopeptide repeat protein [Candidatus Omnitrophota bacterium]